jgi:hypothetical protein
MQGRASKRDYWLFSLVPFAAGVAIYMAKENGATFSLPFSASTPALGDINAQLPGSPNWAQAFQSNGLALGAILVGAIVGVLLFTWIALMAIEAKRKAEGWLEQKHAKERGPVTGMLKDEGKAAWTSAALDTSAEPEAYTTRVSNWIRHTVEDDKTSGVLRLDR